jgi:putative peptidoglycan lipid II flippase
VGLALATAIGAWINFALVVWFASRAGLFAVDARLKASTAKIVVAGCALAAVLWLTQPVLLGLFHNWGRVADLAALAALAAIGAIVYGCFIAALFGRQWLTLFRRGRIPPKVATDE